MDVSLMMLKCDHCRGGLGFSAHRYGRMRFCSDACIESYRRRLDDDTQLKIGKLDFAGAKNSHKVDALRLGYLLRRLGG